MKNPSLRLCLLLSESLLWFGGLLMLVGSCMEWSRARRAIVSTSANALPAPLTVEVFDADSLAEAADGAGDWTLFRSPVRETNSAVPSPTIRPPRRPLVLRGLLGGPPWNAVLEGLPGHEGAVVMRLGETLAGLRVRAVLRDTVFVQGTDTSWKLTVRRP